jgi:hypothetical protein
VRFSTRDWRDDVHQAAKDFKFHATLKPRLDRTIEDWHQAQPEALKPVVRERADGGFSIHAPWSDDAKQDPPR